MVGIPPRAGGSASASAPTVSGGAGATPDSEARQAFDAIPIPPSLTPLLATLSPEAVDAIRFAQYNADTVAAQAKAEAALVKQTEAAKAFNDKRSALHLVLKDWLVGACSVCEGAGTCHTLQFTKESLNANVTPSYEARPPPTVPPRPNHSADKWVVDCEVRGHALPGGVVGPIMYYAVRTLTNTTSDGVFSYAQPTDDARFSPVEWVPFYRLVDVSAHVDHLLNKWFESVYHTISHARKYNHTIRSELVNLHAQAALKVATLTEPSKPIGMGAAVAALDSAVGVAAPSVRAPDSGSKRKGQPKAAKGAKDKSSEAKVESDNSTLLSSLTSTLSALTRHLGSSARPQGDFWREGKGPKPPHPKPRAAHPQGKGKEGKASKAALTNTTHAAKKDRKPKPKPNKQ